MEYNNIDRGSWGLEAINAYDVWNITKGEGVKIAIVDSGISSHDALDSKVVRSINFRRGEEPYDLYGHGTSVAGVIAGDFVGVAPKSELYIAKSLDKYGNGSPSHIFDGISMAINFKVDILCLSLGGRREPPKGIAREINRATSAGVIVVSATGNQSRRASDYPAQMDNVIGVGGFDKEFNRAKFSNYNIGLDLLAPSVDVLTTDIDNTYTSMEGTSMASAYVAGSIALIKSYYKSKGVDASKDMIMDLISKSLDNKGNKEEYGYGLLDLKRIFSNILEEGDNL